ncbi:MAG TPA: hypothetical protein P5044_00520 [bacterium]|nr:hypothetical protein [bacterium]
MHDDSSIKWDEMLTGVMKEGRSIRKRRQIIRTSLISLAALIAAGYLFLQDPEKSDQDLIAQTDKSSEIEVAIISNDAFFDNDLELLIY